MFRFMIGQYVTVHGDVVSHVNISHVMVEDGGEYSCLAENRAGKTLHSARLNVYGKEMKKIFIISSSSRAWYLLYLLSVNPLTHLH